MTGPSPPTESGAEADEGATSRVTVLAGGLAVDVSLPARVAVSTLMEDLIDLADEQLAVITPERAFARGPTLWTLARLSGTVIEPHRSLGEAGVVDGDVLALCEVGTSLPAMLIDELDRSPGAWSDDGDRWRAGRRGPAWWFALGVIAACAAAASLTATPDPLPGVPVVSVVMFVAGLGCAGAGWLQRVRNATAATWLPGVALPFVVGATLVLLRDGPVGTALLVAMAPAAVVAFVHLSVFDGGRVFYSAVVALAVFCMPAALVVVLTSPPPTAMGAIWASLAVLVVYLSPRFTVGLAKLPLPRVPTAGEPLDDIDTMGGTAVEGVNAIGKQVIPTEEGLAHRVQRASALLTGIIAAAAVVAVVGSILAVDVGLAASWQGEAFSGAVATVLVLRGRSHHDLAQSALLVGAGLLIGVGLLVRVAATVPGTQGGAGLGLMALTSLALACGLVAPAVEFSPVMRRWVELVEYAAIAVVFPLAGSIVGLYGFFRGLRI